MIEAEASSQKHYNSKLAIYPALPGIITRHLQYCAYYSLAIGIQCSARLLFYFASDGGAGRNSRRSEPRSIHWPQVESAATYFRWDVFSALRSSLRRHYGVFEADRAKTNMAGHCKFTQEPASELTSPGSENRGEVSPIHSYST